MTTEITNFPLFSQLRYTKAGLGISDSTLFDSMPRSLEIAWLQLLIISTLCLVSSDANAQLRGFEVDGIEVFPTPEPSSATDSEFIDDATLLAKHGIALNRESFSNFLRRLIPQKDAVERGRKLIQQLSDPKYQVRVNATNQLLNAAGLPDALFHEAIASGDPEQAFRSQEILDARRNSIVDRLRLAVFRRISEQKTNGLVDKIVDTFPHLPNESMRMAAAQAIKVTASKQDVEILVLAASSDDSILKMAALEKLTILAPEKGVRLLAKVSQEKDEALRLETGRLYAKLGRSECLNILVDLLNAEDVSVRSRASVWLRRITRHNILYPAWENKKTRDPVIAKITKWVAAHRDALKIDFKNFDPKLGRILIGLYGNNKVVELDMSGKQLWETELPSAFCCQGLPNGHRLIGQYSAGRIVEYDAQGKLFKEFTNLPSLITSVQRLENGNTLVAAGRTGNVIFELDGAGKKVWEKTVDGAPIHAWLLPTGKILVCLNAANKVCEIKRDGSITWQIKVDGTPYSASRLENGNTLVAISSGGLIEYSPNGKKIRSFPSGKNTYHGELMEDGNLIFADETGLFISDSSGKKIRKIGNYKTYLYLNHY